MIRVFSRTGEKFLFDDDDWGFLQAFSWSYSGPYVQRVDKLRGRQKSFLFHREKLNCQGGVVDHINRNPRDNRQSNLRIVDKSQNALNAKKRANRNGASKFKGVSRASGIGKYNISKPWRCRINIKGKEISLGYFSSEIEAASAFDKYVYTNVGPDFSRNFPEVKWA